MNFVVVGGGLTGLACAIALARRGWENIFRGGSASSAPPGASRGLGRRVEIVQRRPQRSRTERALKDLDLLEPVLISARSSRVAWIGDRTESPRND